RLLTLGLGRGLRVRRRSHVVARGACLGLATARHALPHAALGLVLLVVGDGLAQVAVELLQIRLRRHALVLVALHALVLEIDRQAALERLLVLPGTEKVVIVPT